MKYYKLISDSDDNFYIESKTDLTDEEVFEEALNSGLVDAFCFSDYLIEEISEDEYEENA